MGKIILDGLLILYSAINVIINRIELGKPIFILCWLLTTIGWTIIFSYDLFQYKDEQMFDKK